MTAGAGKMTAGAKRTFGGTPPPGRTASSERPLRPPELNVSMAAHKKHPGWGKLIWGARGMHQS